MPEIKANKKSRESQRIIYKGLRRLLLKKDLCDITVQEISDECNISRSTFYRNFDNVIDVIEVMFDYFYNRYLEHRKTKINQLLFFFEYWGKHKDLVYIIANQCDFILKNCLKKYEIANPENKILIGLKYSIFTSIICEWSISKDETPEDMEKLTRSILNQRGYELLINNNIKL